MARSYLEVIGEYGGCPRKIRTDCGTENGLIAAAQCYFMDDIEKAYSGTLTRREIVRANASLGELRRVKEN